MGVYIHLSVEPRAILAEDWGRVYQEALAVVRAYPPQALNASYRDIGGERVIAYVRDVEDKTSSGSRIRICGDARSKLTGETFEFPQEYGNDRLYDLSGRAETRAGPFEDLLVRAARDGQFSGARIFNAKTQDRPYHTLILALATLVENRFPRYAIAHGDFGHAQGELACDLLERALGERMLPPVVLDRVRVRERLLPVLNAESIDVAITELCPHVPSPFLADFLGVLKDSPSARLRDELERAPACLDASELSEEMRSMIAEVLQPLAELGRRLELHHQLNTRTEPDVRAVLLQLVVKGTRSNSLHLTEDAWRTIEGEPTEVLKFVAVVALGAHWELHLWLLARALLESSAIRCFAFDHWTARSLKDRGSPQ